MSSELINIDLPQPLVVGEVVSGLLCPVGSCCVAHASATAQERLIRGKKLLVWVYSAPCLEKVHAKVLKGGNK